MAVFDVYVTFFDFIYLNIERRQDYSRIDNLISFQEQTSSIPLAFVAIYSLIFC